MANALPSDLLPLRTLKTLHLQAELASAAYADGDPPDGFRDVDLKALGVRSKNIEDGYFVKGNAAARLMERDGDWTLAFRGTDSTDDLFDYVRLGPDYIHEFDALLNAIAGSGHDGKLVVTGHSLGAAAVHLLAAGRSGFGEAFEDADYFSFAAPQFDDPLRVASYGHANDAIYGLLASDRQPFVKNVYWLTSENGVAQVDATDPANNVPHAIANHVDGLARMIASDVLKPAFGLMDERGLDLSTPAVLVGSHEVVMVPKTFDGTVVTLGIDRRLPGETILDRADVIVGRDIGGAADWIDGMRGDDDLSGRAGADHLIGGDGLDTLSGGRGQDVLYGGANRDALEGGEGRDRFVFRDAQGRADLVLDFHGRADTASERQRDVIEIAAEAFGAEAGVTPDIVNGDTRPEPTGDGPTVLYAAASGKLFFDPDGAGAQDAALIAILKNGPGRIEHSDVVVV